MAAIVVLSGPSGSGKSSIIRRALQKTPQVRSAVSLTTRAPRSTDMPGQYRYVDRTEFMNWIQNGRLWEWAEVHGNLYGTISPDPAHDVLLEIDVQGARQIKRRFPGAYLVFIMLPQPWKSVLETRLRGRGTESEENIQRRLSAAGQEIERGMEQSDWVVINDDLETAVNEVLAIISRIVRTA